MAAPAGITRTEFVNATANTQMQSGLGYVASSTAQLVLNLPVSPALADIADVTGAGTGGWKISHNAGQSIVLKSLPTANLPTPGLKWNCRAMAPR